MHYIPSSSLPSSNLLFPESRKQNPRFSPHLHQCQRRSTAGLHVPWHLISTVSTPRPSKKSSFCRRRVVDPFFDPGSNLTFTLLVNGFLPKDQTVPFSLTKFSRFFSFFFFPHQSGKPPIFSVLCLLLQQYLIYNPNIHTLHSRNLYLTNPFGLCEFAFSLTTELCW